MCSHLSTSWRGLSRVAPKSPPPRQKKEGLCCSEDPFGPIFLPSLFPSSEYKGSNKTSSAPNPTQTLDVRFFFFFFFSSPLPLRGYLRKATPRCNFSTTSGVFIWLLVCSSLDLQRGIAVLQLSPTVATFVGEKG